MKTISIIVPIYKVEAYLERCIRSLMQQTYPNIEIILVDDGSPDACPHICDSYAAEDSRIRVIHKCNGGLSDARNAGLAIARGELISFVDSDDWVSLQFLEIMAEVMDLTDADIVECDVLRTDGNHTVNDVEIKPPVEQYGTEEALRLLIEDRKLHQTVWNKLYKRSVLENILFEYGKYNEDEFWTYQVFGRAKNISKVCIPLYCYFQNTASIMGQGYSLRRLDAIEAKANRQAYIDRYYPQLSDIAAINAINGIIYAGQMSLLKLSQEDQRKAFELLDVALSEYRNGKYPLNEVRKRKIWITMSFASLRLTCRLRNSLRMNV